MALPKSFTRVTPFSKWLALSLFIIAPIFAFYLGIYYQKTQPSQQTVTQSITEDTKNWKTYTGTGQFADGKLFSINYPADWEIVDNKLYPYGRSSTNNNSVFSGVPIIVLGSGGFEYGEAIKRNFPAGTADYLWSDDTDKNVSNGLANFTVDNSYVLIRAQNIPLKDSATMKNIFNQMLSTLKVIN